MPVKPAKLMFGALFAASVGLVTVPAAHASSFSASDSRVAGAADTGNLVVADEVTDKAQGKVNEMHDMGSGAANAVEEKHDEHEAAEATSHHHSLKHKAKSKMNEVKGEASGATDAVESAHHEHEQAEHE
jgi:hypothetical protein